MKKILTTALLLVLLALPLSGAARADILYTTVEGGKGTFGAVRVTGTASLDIVSIDTGLSTEIRVLAWGRRYPRAVVIDPLTSPDTARFYIPGQWTSAPAVGTLDKADDILAMDESNNGNSLFAASYGNASIREYSLSDYTPTGRVYTQRAPEGYTAHAQKVIIADNYIYGLFTYDDDIGSGDLYSRVMAFDGQLISDVVYTSVNVGFNATDMTFFGGGLAVAYLGGQRGSVVRGSGIDIINNSVTSPISGDDFGRIETLCRDQGNGLYFTTTKDDTVTLWHWTYSSGSQAVDTYDGSFSQLLWDGSHKTLVLATEEGLFLSGDLGVRTFTNSELGGTLTSIAATSPATEWKEGSSSGCAAAAVPLSLLLLFPVPLILRRRR